MHKIASLAALCAVAALAPHDALAFHVSPGANCHAVGQNANALNYTDRGQVSNPTGATLRVVCPITRMEPIVPWDALRVVVSDRHSTQNITCEAFSAQVDGNGYAQSRTSTQYSPEAWQFETLQFGKPTFERDYGTYYIVCTLPPAEAGRQSTISSYTVFELGTP